MSPSCPCSVVAQTFADESGALGTGIDDLNALLASAETVLPEIRPLLAQAPPVVQQLTSTADLLRPALDPTVHEALATADALGPAANAAVPALKHALVAERYLRPLVVRIHPLVENLVPILGWVRARLTGIEAFIANDADAMDHGDAIGPWLQGFIEVTNTSVTGGDAGCSSPIGLCVNPYPKPGDSSDPQPYVAGDFPHLMPYFPR
jgi:ABC-type transporter Mla subunit MlaD